MANTPGYEPIASTTAKALLMLQERMAAVNGSSTDGQESVEEDDDLYIEGDDGEIEVRLMVFMFFFRLTPRRGNLQGLCEI